MSDSESSASSASSASNPVPSQVGEKRKRSAIESDLEPQPEVSALSHAERRRQKKKKLIQDVEGVEPAKKQKLADGSAIKKKPQNSIWIGNLAFKTTADHLRTFFQDCGEVTRVHLPMKAATRPNAKKENQGFAYVDFATLEAKLAAIAKSEKPLTGRKVLIKDGEDFTGRPKAGAVEGATEDDSRPTHKSHTKTEQKILKAQKQPPAPTLFLGNLGYETTDESIRELFDAHRPKPAKVKSKSKEGDLAEKLEADVTEIPVTEASTTAEKTTGPNSNWIRKVRMGTFEDSGLCKGFAFVDFANIEHATSALINIKNHHLNGRNLVVEYASAEAVRRGASRPKTVPNSDDKSTHRPYKARTFDKARSDKGPRKSYNDAMADDAPEKLEQLSRDPPLHATEVEAEEADGERGARPERRHKGPKSRPRPGAALALAKRQSAAILPSTGKKITF